MVKNTLAFISLFFLTACGGIYFPLVIITPAVSPSSLPVILSPALPFIRSDTPTTTLLPLILPLTETPSTTPGTPTSSFTPAPGWLLDILGCNTSLDITHQMGEVTNAYPTIRNTTGNGLTNVCATLTASDEA